ncbi:hypothetical protein ACLNGM_20170 [Aureimonas phyllosphaerae]|uniref:hypothetical protein n=1 Tax=Aureimonas phyllosphaerae TaxID=1166078 RepID=UPI003A5BE18E
MINRSTFMKSVWVHFRRVANPRQAFCRKLFAQVLAFMWKSERIRIQADRETAARRAQPVAFIVQTPARPLSPTEARIDSLKYLSARYNISLMEREIRAEYSCA